MAKRQKKPAEKPTKPPRKGMIVVKLGPAAAPPRDEAHKSDERIRSWEPLEKAFDAYRPVAAKLAEQAQMTGTPGWQAAYTQELERHNKMIVAFAKAIQADAKAIETGGISEATEKAIKDSVKMLMEEREGHEAWHARQIKPLIDLCSKARGILDQLIADARNVESTQALLFSGLTDHVNHQIRTRLARWDWDPKGGRIVLAAEYTS